ncbi:helix-turn-helix domain-containing protein [Clostridium perfringens]|uniref:helix-turn-helix domain-containing protein n=1 Tax=Clostridium perfringens TaxID=1502 RepID=UPI0024BC9E6B|nr:helix-turn-helix transcriptional regulator [Clostridium perfringens]
MLGENFKRIRKNKRMSTRELARECNMCNSIIANIESGKSKNPTIDTVKKLAKALDVTIDELVK